MGQCLSCCKRPKDHIRETQSSASRQHTVVPKQDKNIDDKRMFKLGIDVLNRDFCIQIGYNRKAVKTYGQRKHEAREGEPSTHLEGMTETVRVEDLGVRQTPLRPI